MPAAGRFCLGPPRGLHQQGEGGLLLAPRLHCLARRTRARGSRHQSDLVRQTHTQGAAPLGLTLGHDPAQALSAQDPDTPDAPQALWLPSRPQGADEVVDNWSDCEVSYAAQDQEDLRSKMHLRDDKSHETAVAASDSLITQDSRIS